MVAQSTQGTEPDFYALLEVAPGARPAEIQAQWRKLCRRFDPGRFPTSKQQQHAYARLKGINEAYTTLNDPAARNRYDASRRVAKTEEPTWRSAVQGPVVHLPAGMSAVQGPAPQQQFAPQLPHRYVPDRQQIVFDGVTYLSLQEAAKRLNQPLKRLEWYLQMGELYAVDFDGRQWVTEASLIPLRTRAKRHRVGAQPPQRVKQRMVAAPPRRRAKAQSPRMHASLEAPYQDYQARHVLSAAPTLFLLVIFGLLWCLLANAPASIRGLNELGQQAIGMFGK